MPEALEEPLIDPDTGELLASTEEERRSAYIAALAEWSEAKAKADQLYRSARDAERRALLLWTPAAPAFSGDEEAPPAWAEIVKPPRKVDKAAIDARVEVLPAALRPQEVVTTSTKWPGVREVEAHRADLARVGITPDLLLYQPPPHPALRQDKGGIA